MKSGKGKATIFILLLTSCQKFVQIPPPPTDLIKSTVFESDATAQAAMTDIYYNLSRSSFLAGNVTNSMSYVGAITSDEITNYNSDPEVVEFYNNRITPVNNFLHSFWDDPYTYIYKSNAVIEGLKTSVSVSDSIKKQLDGEAKFMRSLCNFYLVNLFGDIPLVLSTDYKTNTALTRSPQAQVYQQIFSDLQDAQNELANDYSISNGDRIIPDKFVATALLARVFLYTKDWKNAEIQATSVINNNAYNLSPDLTTIFFNGSTEAIWQLTTPPGSYPGELSAFYMFYPTPNNGALPAGFINNFEPGDLRKNFWIGTVITPPDTFYFPMKYHSFVPAEEYSTIFRLAEQYLIRAEARANLGEITGSSGAESDINMIRNRAGLANTTANTQASMIAAIMQERRIELFTEFGHRWFDLKRTGTADAILGSLKSPNWQATDTLFPIPQSQILNSTVTQNQGY